MKDAREMPSLLDRPPWSIVIGVLILVSILGFSVETLPDLSKTTRFYLSLLEITTVGIFTIEYLARVALAKRKIDYIFSFMGLIDLLAIIPFYLALYVDLRPLRLLRLLRFIRLLKLVRYNAAFSRFSRALAMAREELIIFSVASAIVLYLSAAGIYYFEHPVQPDVYRSIFDALWWAIATLTTVGYGDIYPVTAGGRGFTFIVLMIGLGLVAVPTGIVASSLSAVRREEAKLSDH